MQQEDRPETAPAQGAREQIVRLTDDPTAPREPQRIGDVVARIIAQVGPRRARRRRGEGGAS